MITNKGKLQIKRFLSMQVRTIGASIGFGLGGATETSGDTRLQFEVDRENVRLVSYDFNNNQLIFKTEIPAKYAGTIYEVGLYNLSVDNTSNSRLISPFDSSGMETWTTGSGAATFVSTNSRIGSDALNHTPAASASMSSILSSLSLDLSTNLDSDTFSLAFYNTNANVATIVVRLRSDSSNYYQYTITAPSTGYQIVNFTRGSATITGSPNWSSINSIEVITTSNSSGASNVALDGLRINATVNDTSELILVAREVLDTPYVKENGKTQEIEFVMDVNVA